MASNNLPKEWAEKSVTKPNWVTNSKNEDHLNTKIEFPPEHEDNQKMEFTQGVPIVKNEAESSPSADDKAINSDTEVNDHSLENTDAMPTAEEKASIPIQSDEDGSVTAAVSRQAEETKNATIENKSEKTGKKAPLIILIAILLIAVVGASVFFLNKGLNSGSHVTQTITEVEAGVTYSVDDLFSVEDGYVIKDSNVVYEFYTGEVNDSGKAVMYSNDELETTVEITVVKESGKESSESFVFKTIDKTVPEITGEDSYIIQLGSSLDDNVQLTFFDPGIKGLNEPVTMQKFESELGGKVEIDVSKLDTSHEGKYEVKISATDFSGNTAEKTIEVEVIDGGSVIVPDANIQYEANIFLSNFTEQNIYEMDIETCTPRDYASFVMYYMMLNEGASLSNFPVSEYETMVGLPVDTFEAKMNRFFGFELGSDNLNTLPSPKSNSQGPFFDGQYVYDWAPTGFGIPPVAIVNEILNFADGHQEMKFSVYQCYESGSDYYSLTPEQAASDSRLMLAGSGTAVVKPKDWNGRNTYELVSYSYTP